MDNDFLQGRLTAARASIVAAEAAELRILSGAVESYTIDDGQSRTVVNKLNMSVLRAYIDGLYNRCATIENRLNGSGVSVGRAHW